MQVDPATLPGRPDEDLGDGCLQPGVSVRDHELDAEEPSLAQRAEEVGPEGFIL